MARSSRGSTSVLAIVALVAMGGFLYWLHYRSGQLSSQIQPEMQDTTSAPAQAPSALHLKPGELASRLSAGGGGGAQGEGIMGTTGFLDSATVGQALGRAVFTVQLGDSATYPVLLSPDLIQMDKEPAGGDRVTLHGTFYSLTDSIRKEWANKGAVEPSAVSALPRSNTFLLADSLKQLLP